MMGDWGSVLRVLAGVEIFLHRIQTGFGAFQTSYQMRCSAGVLSSAVRLVPSFRLCGTAHEFPHSLASHAKRGQFTFQLLSSHAYEWVETCSCMTANSCVGRKVYISPITVNFFFALSLTFAVGNSKQYGYIPFPSCHENLVDLKLAILLWYTPHCMCVVSVARTGFCCPSTFSRYSLKLTYVTCYVRALLTEILKMKAASSSETSLYAENITRKTVIWIQPAVTSWNLERYHVDSTYVMKNVSVISQAWRRLTKCRHISGVILKALLYVKGNASYEKWKLFYFKTPRWKKCADELN